MIAYDCGNEGLQIGNLCVVKPDGTGLTDLTNTPAGTYEGSPAFSPDGRRIAFFSHQSDVGGLELINVDGSGRTPLGASTGDSDLFPWDLAFFPDGRRVVFLRGSSNAGDLHAINSDGSGEVNLTNGAFGSQPTVSSDGETIAFLRYVTEECVPAQPFKCEVGRVFTMRPDGSAQTQITASGTGASELQPAFGPDGRIAFTRIDGVHADIWVMNADGSGQTDLTNTPGTDESAPEFSPDGAMIVYAAQNGLGVMKSDGSGRRALLSSPPPADIEQADDPSWQPIHRCGGRSVTILGDDGPDLLKGTKRADVIMAFGGRDRIKGRGGNDRICGGAGKDRISGGKGHKDLCFGGQGRDRAKGCERGKP